MVGGAARVVKGGAEAVGGLDVVVDGATVVRVVVGGLFVTTSADRWVFTTRPAVTASTATTEATPAAVSRRLRRVRARAVWRLTDPDEQPSTVATSGSGMSIR